MDSFSVGDICEIIWVGNPMLGDKAGQECVIVDFNPRCKCGECHCTIRTQDGILRDAGFDQLRKKRPPSEYDGNQVTKWDDCPFRPREVVRV